MSGGSYDYLYTRARPLGDQRNDLERMAIRLEGLPWAAQAAAALSEWEAMRARYAGVPAVLAVLDIHKPDGSDRLECELSEDNELPTHWPCSTFEAIRDAVTP